MSEFVKDDSGKHEAILNYWKGFGHCLDRDSDQQNYCYAMHYIKLCAVRDDRPKLLGYLQQLLKFILSGEINMQDVSRVYTFGATKYGDTNYYSTGVDYARYINALARHVESFVGGETHAEDSKEHHLTHAAANCAILIELLSDAKNELTNSLTKYLEGTFKND